MSRRSRSRGSFPNFIERGFVLIVTRDNQISSKLSACWSGPAGVVAVLNKWIYVVRDLITANEQNVHCTRLKFFRDASLHVTQPLIAMVARDTEGHFIKELHGVRLLDGRHGVEWDGFESAHNTWEPVANICQDAPAWFKQLLRRASDQSWSAALMQTLSR